MSRLKDNSTAIRAQFSVFPEEAFLFGVYGKLTIDRYDEWYICRDSGVTISASRTGNVMYASKIHYLKKDSSGRTLAFGERLDSSQLSVMLELRNYYRLLATLRADVSTLQNPILIDLGEWMTRHLYAHCPSLTPSVGAPVGFVVAAVKGLSYVRQNPYLLAIPISVTGDFANTQGVEYKATYENVGARYGNGYNVVEYVDIYAFGSKVKVAEGCVVDLPLGYVISR